MPIDIQVIMGFPKLSGIIKADIQFERKCGTGGVQTGITNYKIIVITVIYLRVL